MKLLSALGLGAVVPLLLSTATMAAVRPVTVRPIQEQLTRSYAMLMTQGIERLDLQDYRAALEIFE